jgi:hypothetical protein
MTQHTPPSTREPETAIETLTPLAPSLIIAAVAVGRMSGEPAMVLHPLPRLSLLRRIFGIRRSNPLSDPRLEVLRAISASLAKGVAQIGEEFVAAAHRVGWTNDDLGRAFPGVPMRVPAR